MMNFKAYRQSAKAVLGIGALLAGFVAAQPAYSAQSDLDRIQSYVGVWRGSGKLVDDAGGSETLRCRVTMSSNTAEKITMNGSCTGSGLGVTKLTGTLAYVASANRYEAVISAPIDSTVRGRKNGSNIKFNFSQSVDDERVDSASALFLLQPDTMSLDFTINFSDGGKWNSSIPMARR